MEPTYTVHMFTPHFPSPAQRITGLTFEDADAKAATWIIQLQAEGYRTISHAKNTPRKLYIFDCYREHNPTWVRIRITKETNHG